jgi:hypothetical protein
LPQHSGFGRNGEKKKTEYVGYILQKNKPQRVSRPENSIKREKKVIMKIAEKRLGISDSYTHMPSD